MRVDLVDLSLFRHVVEAGSITHGAERAHLALAAASTRIRNMEQALGARAADARTAGRDADAGRAHAAAARPHHAGAGRAAARGSRRLCGRARRPGARAVEHQCADRIPARDPERVPRRASERQRRSGGAAVRRDRRADRRRRRRHRHRGRHGRCRRARDVSRIRSDRFVLVVARDHPLAKRQKIGFAEVLEHDFVGLDRASALPRFLADKAARAGRSLRLRVQLRSFDGVCRLVERNVGVGIVPETTARFAARSMAISAVQLTDLGAARPVDLRARLQGAAAVCAAAGRSHARGASARSTPESTAAPAPSSRDRGSRPDRPPRRS